MGKILRILTFPIWFPIKALWTLSKILAFIVLVVIVVIIGALILYGADFFSFAS